MPSAQRKYIDDLVGATGQSPEQRNALPFDAGRDISRPYGIFDEPT